MPWVETPDGWIEFPESMLPQEIANALNKRYGKPAGPPLPEFAQAPARHDTIGPATGDPSQQAPITSDMIVKGSSDPDSPADNARSAVRYAADGATFGLFPKAVAALSAIPGAGSAPGPRGATYKDRYANELDYQRAVMEESRRNIGAGGADAAKAAGQVASIMRLPPALGRAGLGLPGAANLAKHVAGTTLDISALNAGVRGVDAATEPGAAPGAGVEAAAEEVSPEALATNAAGAMAVPLATQGGPRLARALGAKLGELADRFAYRALRPTTGSAEPMIDKFGSTRDAGAALRQMRLADGTPIITKDDTATTILNKLKVYTSQAQQVLESSRAAGAEAPFNVNEVVGNLNAIGDRYFNNAGGRTANAAAAGAARKEFQKIVDELTARTRSVPSYDLEPVAVRVGDSASPEGVYPNSASFGAPPRLVGEDIQTRPAVTEKRPPIRKKGKFASGGVRVVQPGGPEKRVGPMTGEPTRESTTRPAPQPDDTDLGWRRQDVEVPVGAPVADLPTTQDITSLKKAYGKLVHNEGSRRYPMSKGAIANDPELSALNEATGVLTKAEEESLRNALSPEQFRAFMRAKGQYGAGEGLADVAYGGMLNEQTPRLHHSLWQTTAHLGSKIPVLPRTLRGVVESTAGYGGHASDAAHGLGKWADRLQIPDMLGNPELARVIMLLRAQEAK